MRTYRSLILVGALAATPLLPGCFGGDKDDVEEPAEDAGAAEPAAADEAPAEAAPAAAPEAAAEPTPAPAAAPAEPEGFNGQKVTRYVTTVAVKIHPQPAKDSPVLGWVKKGDKLDVVINGEWAKIDNGKYISAKYLAEQDPGAAAPAAAKKSTKKAKKSK